MFQTIGKIPTDENYKELDYHVMKDHLAGLRTQLYELYGPHIQTTAFTARTAVSAMHELFTYIDAMNCEDNDHVVLGVEYRRSSGNFVYVAGDSCYKNSIGLMINIDSETNYGSINSAYKENLTEMEGAEEVLKANGRNFLKIFVRKDNPNLLFIWTNRDLTPSQFYKIKVLQNRLNKENIENFNPFTEKLYAAFEKQNLDEINEIFKEFSESDIIKERRYRKFLNTFSYDAEAQKQRLENAIRRSYEIIRDYENYIASEATKIENCNAQLYTLMHNNKSEEEYKELYNYIKRHRHIIGIDTENSAIVFTFKSPLIYYSDYAIEKIIKHYEKESSEYKILDLFLNHKDEFELYTICRIRFTPATFTIDSYRRNDFETEIMGQPHIDQYGCFGNHREGIDETAVTKDYIGAIEQINQATMNMNFYDGCVADYLIRTLRNKSNTIHTWKDKTTGEMITTAEAIRRATNEEA